MRAYELPGGTVPIKTEKGKVWPDRPYADGACLSQTVLEGIMRTHLAKYDVVVELGKVLIAIDQDADTVTSSHQATRWK